MKKANTIKIAGIFVYFIFITVSVIIDFSAGKQIGINLFSFLIQMLKVLPCAFILIGLFEVWVKRETVEKHFGEASGFKGYIWAILLAGTTVGGLYVVFPIAYSLYNKGAKLNTIFTFISASAICKIPMAMFESSFMGIKFTAIRILVSLPLVIVTSMLLGNYLSKSGYKILQGK